MNIKIIITIALRLLAIYLFFKILPSIGLTLYNLVVQPEYSTFEMIGYQLAISGLYIVVMIILVKYSKTLAEIISKDLPDEPINSPLESINLLSVLIAASAVFVLISSIPTLINQAYGFIIFYQSELESSTEKQRFNNLIVGLFGVTFQIVVASIIFINSKKLAAFWEKVSNKALVNKTT
jgi:hypothetical protein